MAEVLHIEHPDIVEVQSEQVVPAKKYPVKQFVHFIVGL